MVELIHSPELDSLYNEIYRQQIRVGSGAIFGGNNEALEALSEKISKVREKNGFAPEISDRDIADAIWKHCSGQVRANI